MKYCRRMLMLAVILVGCSVAYLAVMMPWLFIACVAGLCIYRAKKGKPLTNLGSARWANEDDLREMIDA